MELVFSKMNGAGNDLILLDNRELSLDLKGPEIARLCDRHRGVGADGVLLAEPSATPDADLRMRYYNADGGEAEMCGNGARCFARYARTLYGDHRNQITFMPLAGPIRAIFAGNEVEVTMSHPHSFKGAQTLEADGCSMDVYAVNTGVPHAVTFVKNLDAVDIAAAGRTIRHHPAFAPKGANANFVRVVSPDYLEARTFERGVEGETLACGTGVCAAAIVHHLIHAAPRAISVKVLGGETLRVRFESDGNSVRNVTLAGPADFVFEGRISL